MPFPRTYEAWKSQHFNSRTFQGLYEPWVRDLNPSVLQASQVPDETTQNVTVGTLSHSVRQTLHDVFTQSQLDQTANSHYSALLSALNKLVLWVQPHRHQ